MTFSFVNAQEDSLMTNKNGYPILPERGEIAVGMTMNPIFTYFGNFFNGTQNNVAPIGTFFNNGVPNAIFAKYFIADDAALRFTLEATANTTTNSFYVQDDAVVINDPLSNAQVTDIQTTVTRSYVIGFGYEKRRGSTRLQGKYGANLLLTYQNNNLLYKYGNPMSADNPMPTTHDFGTNIYNGGRILENYGAEQLGLGVNIFIGVEYFILPKLSLGAELGYGVGLNKVKQTKIKYEYWNVDHVEYIEAIDPGDVDRLLGTTNPSANFFLMFHF